MTLAKSALLLWLDFIRRSIDSSCHVDLFHCSINSVFVIGEDSFFGTNLFNSRYRSDNLAQVIEENLAIPYGSVFHVKGNTGKFVAESLLMPNGIAGNNK